MFHVLCRLGHGVSLDAAARGMGIDGKPEGMNGRLAPALWAEGKREELLRYVGQDVRTTLDLATGCESCGAFRWVARSGKMRCMTLGEGWLAVEEARSLPLPDTSWMDEPWPRERFTGWIRGENAIAVTPYGSWKYGCFPLLPPVTSWLSVTFPVTLRADGRGESIWSRRETNDRDFRPAPPVSYGRRFNNDLTTTPPRPYQGTEGGRRRLGAVSGA